MERHFDRRFSTTVTAEMVVTRSPESWDENRAFSGPPLEEASPSTSGMSVPSADQLKALLELKESSPDDLQKLTECAKGASKSVDGANDTSECSDASCDETATDDGDIMETSSDGGSTVREQDRHHGNSGMVNDDIGNWQPGAKRSRRRKSVTAAMKKMSVRGNEWRVISPCL